MPKSCPDTELRFTKQLTRHFLQSAEHSVVSWPKLVDHVEAQPSALIQGLAELEPIQPVKLSDLYQSDMALCFESDDRVQPVTDLKALRSGVQLITHQSACAFKAFAKFRLQAKPSEKASPGLSRMEQGQLIHTALEWFWRKVKTQKTLLSMSQIELDEVILWCVDGALHQHQEVSSGMSEVLKKLEGDRLVRLMKKWMLLETDREPFEVAAIEVKRRYELLGVNFDFRIDRVDRHESGQLLVVDYKHAKQVDVKDWEGDRPKEPQLPLYALAWGKWLAGIVFAQVQMEKQAWKGKFTQQELFFQKDHKQFHKVDSWEDEIQSWKIKLEKLLQDFLDGDASVNPRDQLSTCRYCDFQSICRVNFS